MSQPKNTRTTANAQAILALITVLVLITGIGLALRGIFLKNQPTSNTRVVTGAELTNSLSPNSPLAVTGVDTQVLGSSTSYWAEKVSSSFTPIHSTSDLLSVSTPTQTYIGELKSNTYTVSTYLPAGIEILAYLDPATVIYSRPGTQTSASTLLVMQSDEEKQLHRLTLGAKYTSVLLDPADKILYFAYQLDNYSVISSLRPNGQEVKIYTAPTTPSIELLNIVSSSQKLYYKGANQSVNECTALDLTTKTPASTPCQELRQNLSGNNLQIIPADPSGVAAAKVTFASAGSKNSQTLFTANFHETILDVDRNSEFVTVLLATIGDLGQPERYVAVTKLTDNAAGASGEVARYNLSDLRIEDIKFNHEGKVLAINRASLSEQLLIENPGTFEFQPVDIPICAFGNCHISFIE